MPTSLAGGESQVDLWECVLVKKNVNDLYRGGMCVERIFPDRKLWLIANSIPMDLSSILVKDFLWIDNVFGIVSYFI